jgi:NAD-reducing hydrogenase large subunit
MEILYAFERAEELLNDTDITGSDLRVTSNHLQPEGIGVIEAPRGTLIHHYQVNDKGAIENVNLIVATGHNNYAMNKGVEMVAKEFINGSEIKEGALNRMEHVIRCYDPCLSCSTHAVGKMPLMVTVVDHEGNEIARAEKH